jgi:hypothetical protein
VAGTPIKAGRTDFEVMVGNGSIISSQSKPPLGGASQNHGVRSRIAIQLG